MLERVLGSPTHPPVLPQEHAQPAGAEMHACLLLQIAGESLGRPHVEGQSLRARRRFQRRLHGGQIGGIRLHGSARARRVAERSHSARRKAGQPVLHRLHRPPAPARNPLHIVAQRGGFDHLQPFAHPPREIRALQLPLHVLALLRRDHVADTHAPAPSLLPNASSALQLSAAYLLSTEFTSAYLARLLVRARSGPSARDGPPLAE